MNVLVRPARKEEWEPALELAWRTFLAYNAEDYTPEGVESFKNFLENSILYRMFCVGSYEVFLAVEDDKILGMISVRNVNHISLMFVEKEYVGLGIGRKMMFYVADYIRNEVGGSSITVDAAPYALGFYRKMGFYMTDSQRCDSGITYTPMQLNLSIKF